MVDGIVKKRKKKGSSEKSNASAQNNEHCKCEMVHFD